MTTTWIFQKSKIELRIITIDNVVKFLQINYLMMYFPHFFQLFEVSLFDALWFESIFFIY